MDSLDNVTGTPVIVTPTTTTIVTPPQQFIDFETVDLIFRVFDLGVNPVISLIGIVGNIISIVIVSKMGLGKSSSVWIVALTVADVAFLLGKTNFARQVLNYANPTPGFFFPEKWSFIMFVMFEVFLFLDFVGAYCSLTFPIVIITDRLIAVFLPNMYNLIVTRKRTLAVICLISAFYMGWRVFAALGHKHVYFGRYGVGQIHLSELHGQHVGNILAINKALLTLTSVVTGSIVGFGCLVIVVKFIVDARLRKKKTPNTKIVESGKQAHSLTTTKVLLVVCFVHSVTTLYTYLLIKFLIRTRTWHFGILKTVDLSLSINSSCNFFILVIMNKEFRARLLRRKK